MNELKNVIYFIGIGLTIGFGLVVYAHANFASKSTVEKMDERIYQIWTKVVKEKTP